MDCRSRWSRLRWYGIIGVVCVVGCGGAADDVESDAVFDVDGDAHEADVTESRDADDTGIDAQDGGAVDDASDAGPLDAEDGVFHDAVDTDSGAEVDAADASSDDADTPDAAEGICDPEAMVRPDSIGLEQALAANCPAGMVDVGEFCIDAFESALIEVLDDETTRPWSPYHSPGEARVRAVSVAGVVPQAYITQTQAAAACEEAGKRLCAVAEWDEACRGSLGATFPYGMTRVDGACNDERAMHPVIEYFGTTEPWIWSELDNACINQLPASLAVSGAFAQCVAESGAYDLVGNLHEWLDDPAGTSAGGFYVDATTNGAGCSYRTTAHDVSWLDYATGFRCCAAHAL